MEIKDNKMIINIPSGMEIDVENSNLKEGIIKFKKKKIDYVDVCISLNTEESPIIVANTNCEKLKAISKLMDIADYYNKGWKPNWNNIDEHKFFIIYDNIDKIYTTDYNTTFSINAVYFKHEEDAQAVIDNPNFREILDEIYKS